MSGKARDLGRGERHLGGERVQPTRASAGSSPGRNDAVPDASSMRLSSGPTTRCRPLEELTGAVARSSIGRARSNHVSRRPHTAGPGAGAVAAHVERQRREVARRSSAGSTTEWHRPSSPMRYASMARRRTAAPSASAAMSCGADAARCCRGSARTSRSGATMPFRGSTTCTRNRVVDRDAGRLPRPSAPRQIPETTSVGRTTLAPARCRCRTRTGARPAMAMAWRICRSCRSRSRALPRTHTRTGRTAAAGRSGQQPDSSPCGTATFAGGRSPPKLPDGSVSRRSEAGERARASCRAPVRVVAVEQRPAEPSAEEQGERVVRRLPQVGDSAMVMAHRLRPGA